jgi:hypothetical protein
MSHPIARTVGPPLTRASRSATREALARGRLCDCRLGRGSSVWSSRACALASAWTSTAHVLDRRRIQPYRAPRPEASQGPGRPGSLTRGGRTDADWDFVWDFARPRGAQPLSRTPRSGCERPRSAGASSDGETRTRTGDTTIFREPRTRPLRRQVPANQALGRRPTECRCLCLRSVPRGFGTPRAPRSPNARSRRSCQRHFPASAVRFMPAMTPSVERHVRLVAAGADSAAYR